MKTEARATLERALHCINGGDSGQALGLFNQILAAEPGTPHLLYGKAAAEARLGRQRESRQTLQQLLSGVPDHFNGARLLAELTDGNGRANAETPGASEVEARAAIERARQLLRNGNGVEAMRLAEGMAARRVRLPELHYVRALCLNAVGRHEEALAAAREELDHDPKHAGALDLVGQLTPALARAEPKRTEERSWSTSLSRDTLLRIQQATHGYCWRGVPTLKNPFDFALYPLLIWNLKPRTIFEIGSKQGGSALWLADLLTSYGIDGSVYSLDIVKVTGVAHPRVTFLEGNGRLLRESFSPEFVQSLPRPFLVIEDADHEYETSRHVIEFFDPWLDPGDYIVIEDGIISDLSQIPDGGSGPHRALREFLNANRGRYEIDAAYCDYFGYNVTWNSNGYLRKIAPRRGSVVAGGENISKANRAVAVPVDLLQRALGAFADGDISGALALAAGRKAWREPVEGLDLLRARCFLAKGETDAAREAAREELRYFPGNSDARALLAEIDSPTPSFATKESAEAEFLEILPQIQPFTMLSVDRLRSLFTLARKVCEENRPGNFIECGTAAGGSAALLGWVVKRFSKLPRHVYAFDSFDGMPQPTVEDKHQGIPAESTGWGAGTCAAPVQCLRQICAQLGVLEIVQPVKGYFQETLPRLRDWTGMIALLHLDGDWYESTKVILQNLYDRVVNQGFLQVDDYGHWEGCRQAVHEFERSRNLKFALQPIDSTGVWFRKPDDFPCNPRVAADLAERFAGADPARLGIVSQMSENERFQVFHAIQSVPSPLNRPLRYVEVGSYAGASLALIHAACQGIEPRVEGFAIEPGGQPQFHEVLKKLGRQVRHLQLVSHEAAAKLREIFERDRNFSRFILIDGDHTYEGVRQDILDYYPLLGPGGVMIFHDFLPALDEQNRESILFHHGGKEPGVRRACLELMEQTHRCEVLELPLLHPTEPTQTQAELPIIPGVFSTIRAYRKPPAGKECP